MQEVYFGVGNNSVRFVFIDSFFPQYTVNIDEQEEEILAKYYLQKQFMHSLCLSLGTNDENVSRPCGVNSEMSGEVGFKKGLGVVWF